MITVPNPVSPQERIQLLRDELLLPSEAAERILKLNELAWLLRDSASKEALSLAQEAYRLCEIEFEIRPDGGVQQQLAIARSLLITGICRWRIAEYKKSSIELLEALRLFNLIREVTQRDDHESALVGLADTMNALGNVFLSLGDYPKSLEYYHDALRIREQTGDVQGQASALNNIGLIHFKLGDSSKALQLYDESLKLRASANPEMRSVTFGNIGEVHRHLGNYEMALHFYRQSLEASATAGRPTRNAAALNNIGAIYSLMGNYDQSLAFIQESLTIEEIAGNKYGQVEALLELAEVYRRVQSSEKVFGTLHEALSLAESIGAKALVSSAHRALSVAYKQNHDFERALFHHEAFHEAKEVILGEEQNKILRSLQVVQETEQARREAEMQRIKNLALAAANEEKTRLLERLQEQAKTLEFQAKNDILTGLPNRRSYDEIAAQEFRRTARHQRGFTVAIADVDYFKKINDTYSHQIGDEVLKRIAILMRINCRAEDMVARYGGEEFVFLFPETRSEQAFIACEKIRASIEKFDWSQIQKGLQVTVSIGVCGDTMLPNYEKMLSVADRHLYEAKESGRNKVIV
jgi:diguanylate cyclase (GGDEF)-like protein